MNLKHMSFSRHVVHHQLLPYKNLNLVPKILKTFNRKVSSPWHHHIGIWHFLEKCTKHINGHLMWKQIIKLIIRNSLNFTKNILKYIPTNFSISHGNISFYSSTFESLWKSFLCSQHSLTLSNYSLFRINSPN